MKQILFTPSATPGRTGQQTSRRQSQHIAAGQFSISFPSIYKTTFMRNLLLLLLITAASFFSCKKQKPVQSPYVTETKVDISTHKLTAYSVIKNSKYLVVFEAGLGDGHESWNPTLNQRDIAVLSDSVKTDILMYDRAGYGKSGFNAAPRNIIKLRSELEMVINQLAGGRKVVLVAHSLGGLIIRDYAIKNPAKVAALLLADPSHEAYNQPTQATEDLIYNMFVTSFGANSGAATEARQLIEDFQYSATLNPLPNVPVIVLTSMKHDASNNYSDAAYGKTRQDWYNAHEQLRTGVTDFTHVQTVNAGHYIHQQEPALFLTNLKLLLSKLP